jgi:two-component system, LytTR family, sensor kinase
MPVPHSLTISILWFDKFYNGILSSLVLYVAILAASYVLDSRERLAYQQTETARLSEQLSKAQLDALRRQIEPHFLFNTLNAVSGLVREGRNGAQTALETKGWHTD